MKGIYRFRLLIGVLALGLGLAADAAAQKPRLPAVSKLSAPVVRPANLIPAQAWSIGLLSPRAWAISAGRVPSDVAKNLTVFPVVQADEIAARIERLEAAARRSFFPGKQTIDAVIFDLDGTLLDSLGAWEHSGTNFLRTQGINPPEGLDEKLAQMSLMDGARLVKKMFGLPQPPEELLRLTLLPVRQRYFTDIPAKPGVPEMVRYLRAQGIKLCVATASDRELAEAALKRLGLWNSFDFIITCDEVGIGKRSPAVYEAALKKLGTSKARTLVVEDALYALETAKKAGFPAAAIAEEHAAGDQPALQRAADYYIRSFDRCTFGR